jgi:hypothetical protein
MNNTYAEQFDNAKCKWLSVSLLRMATLLVARTGMGAALVTFQSMADSTRQAPRDGDSGGMVCLAGARSLLCLDPYARCQGVGRVPVSWRLMYAWRGLPGGTCRAEEELERDMGAYVAFKGTWCAL